MNPTSQPPPLPPKVPGMGRVFVASLFPTAVLLVAALLGLFEKPYQPTLRVVVVLSLLVPAWFAWNLHQRRRAMGQNILPNPWLAAGAGFLSGLVFTVAMTVLAFVVLILVVFGMCALSNGKLGG